MNVHVVPLRESIKPCPFQYAIELTFMAPRSEGGGIAFWDVETTGNYGDDCRRGRALGAEYLAYIGKHPTNGSQSLLGCIVNAMLDSGTSRGLVVGFMGAVNEYAMAAATLLADNKEIRR